MKNKKLEISKKHFSAINIFIILIIAIYCPAAFTQEPGRLSKHQLAQQFERAGEWERAVKLYEELHRVDPTNFNYIDGLQRSYTQIKEYEKAAKVIRGWLIIQPRDINMMTTLGGLYYNLNKETTADSVWKAAIAVNPDNAQFYRIVANELLERRLYDKCIRLYLEGRSKTNSDALFADELATIYAALQQYNSSALEYVRLVKKTPEQLAFVQSRLNAFITKPEALRAASAAVKTEVKSSPDNIVLHRLLAWLLMEENQHDSALEQYRIIDRLSNARGNELYGFAQRLSQEHASKTASDAFKEIIDENKNSILLPHARFGYARALEDMLEETDSTTFQGNLSSNAPGAKALSDYRNIIQLYESIAAEYQNRDLIAQSLFRIGMIKYEKVHDLDGALSAFNRVKDLPPTSNILFEASIKIGDVQLARNNLREAQKEYEKLSRNSLVIYKDRAVFKLAELHYFEMRFDSALSMLMRFSTNPNTDLANDALQLQYFIQENKGPALQALGEFAKADLFMRQRKYSESLVQFQDITKRYPMALLIDDALMKIGELNLLLLRPKDAIAAFYFVADSMQLSILKDRAQFRIAEIYQTILNNKSQAIVTYEKLLAQFPNSLYAEESRKRIRLLRGDSI